MSWLPESAKQRMAEQHGVIARQQLLGQLSPDAIRGLVRRRCLVPVQHGVYVSRGAVLTAQGRAKAALLRTHPDARLSGPFVLGLVGAAEFSLRDPFLVLRPPDRRISNVDFPHAPLPRPSVTSGIAIDGLETTHPAHALIDAARPTFGVSDRRLLAAYDSARWHDTFTTSRFGEILDRLPAGHPGTDRWRRLADGVRLRPESRPERDLGEAFADFVPAPEPQVWVTARRRVDWYFRYARLGVEYLGRPDHATAGGRARDAVREEELAEAGVRILSVVAEDLTDLQALRRWVAAALTIRCRELGLPLPDLPT